jgi:hypothetical protein
MDVIAINRSEACAVLDTGHIVHFSVMLDRDGDETDDASECVCAVAPLPNGDWAVIDFSQFETVSVH